MDHVPRNLPRIGSGLASRTNDNWGSKPMRLTEIFVKPHRPGPENFKIWIDDPVAGEIAMLRQQPE
jgi:hypothetical protein